MRDARVHSISAVLVLLGLVMAVIVPLYAYDGELLAGSTYSAHFDLLLFTLGFEVVTIGIWVGIAWTTKTGSIIAVARCVLPFVFFCTTLLLGGSITLCLLDYLGVIPSPWDRPGG